MKSMGLLAVVVVALATVVSRASDEFTVRSTYLSDGWFQYDVTLHHDPFFREATIGGLGLFFTNFTDLAEAPAGWSNALDQGVAGWAYPTSSPPQIRPWTARFLAHSSNTTFKTKTAGVVLGGTFVPQAQLVSPYLAGEMAYFQKMAALGPCVPSEADGSSTSITASVEIYPDVTIDELYMVSGVPYGLTFSWCSSCTVQIQASTNLTTWTAVTNVLGYAPSTTWTSPVPLWTYGDYFKIRLLATEHRPELL